MSLYHTAGPRRCSFSRQGERINQGRLSSREEVDRELEERGRGGRGEREREGRGGGGGKGGVGGRERRRE